MGRATVVMGTRREIINVMDDAPYGPGTAGLKMVETVWMPLHGQVWAVVEGDWLPRWNPGIVPLHFSSVDDLLAYPERFQNVG